MSIKDAETSECGTCGITSEEDDTVKYREEVDETLCDDCADEADPFTIETDHGEVTIPSDLLDNGPGDLSGLNPEQVDAVIVAGNSVVWEPDAFIFLTDAQASAMIETGMLTGDADDVVRLNNRSVQVYSLGR